jgi:hypothetical protein
MEILQHTTKDWYGGVFTLNFGCMLEYFHLTLVVWCSISIKLWWFGGVFQLNFGGLTKFNGNTPPYHQRLIEILHHTTKF